MIIAEIDCKISKKFAYVQKKAYLCGEFAKMAHFVCL